jgi:hypothetical protein
VALAVTGSTTSGQVFRRRQMSAFRKYRLPLTGSRCELWWLNGRGKTPTFCVFPVTSVAVMEKCCEDCVDGEYYFRYSCLLSADAGVLKALIAVDRRSMVHTVAERSC